MQKKEEKSPDEKVEDVREMPAEERNSKESGDAPNKKYMLFRPAVLGIAAAVLVVIGGYSAVSLFQKNRDENWLISLKELAAAGKSDPSGGLLDTGRIALQNGTIYDSGLEGASEGTDNWNEYCLDKKYQRISAVAVFSPDHRVQETAGAVRIYAEDELVYELPEIPDGTDSWNVCVDIQDVQKLRIQITGKEYVRLADVYLVTKFD